MYLGDISYSDKHYSMLKKVLKETYDIDMAFFESFSITFLRKLEEHTANLKAQLVLENAFTGIETVSLLPVLNEALRVYLKEIFPQKKVKFKESLDYQIDPNTGAAISGDGTDRPDLYWREDQYKLEKKLTSRLQNPEATPEDFIKHDPRDANPIDAPSNKNNIYVSVLNPDKINGLDGDVLEIGINSDASQESPVARSSNQITQPTQITVEPQEAPVTTSEPALAQTPAEVESSLNIPGVNINFYIGNLKEGEMSKIKKMAQLTESVMLEEAELQRAEIVLATKDIVSRLQKQMEDISSMATDDVLPLVDGMKENFGTPTANGFAQKAEAALQRASDGVQELKDLFDSYARALEKHIGDGSTPNDLSLDNEVPVEPEMPNEEPVADLDSEESYEKKSPADALMGESVIQIGDRVVKLSESEMAAVKFAKSYQTSGMPLFLLSESEKLQLKIAAKIIKGKK